MIVKKTFTVDLELKQTTSSKEFRVIEGDTGNVIQITLTDEGSALDLTGCRVIAVFSKANGTSMQDSGVEGNGITIGGTYNNQIEISLRPASFAPGFVECELQIYSDDSMSTLVTTAKYNFYCDRAIFNAETIQATNEYPLLVDLIRNVDGIAEEEAIRVEAENERIAAEAERLNAENDRVTAEEKRKQTEQQRVTAENSRLSAEAARITAESARKTAESARLSAELARSLEENSRKKNEDNRAIAEAQRKQAEATRAAEFREWLNVDSVADTLVPDAAATAELIETDGHKRFLLGIPRGRDGMVADIAAGFYAMSVNDEGHLILTIADDAEPPPLSISEDGHLIYTLD